MGTMRYKPLDKVRIKSIDWYNENKDEVGNIRYKRDGSAYPVFFSKYMSNFCGKILTIKSVFKHSYHMNETSSCVFWTDEMIEGLVEEETKPKFKVGDKITNGEITFTILRLSSDRYGAEDTFGECGSVYFKSQDEWKIVEEKSKKKLSDESWRYKNIFDSSQYPQSFECPDGYIFKDENGNEIHAHKIVLEKKKKEYPKTLEECCDVLDIDILDSHVEGYKYSLVTQFQALLIARDAYWKIAGEEIGLGKPWEPDWTIESSKYIILFKETKIEKHITCKYSRVLAFPTVEMRDAFYENFKEEIEICKELL